MTKKFLLRRTKNAAETALASTDKATFQAMEALVHNLNTMNSRAGAQVPFSSVNYGTDTSPEGRMVDENLLLATDNGLGNGETPIFPVQIFKVKEGINYNPEDPNYDLFRLAIKTSAKRLFSRISVSSTHRSILNTTSPAITTPKLLHGLPHQSYGKHLRPDKSGYLRQRKPEFHITNLPRLGIRANRDIDTFYKRT